MGRVFHEECHQVRENPESRNEDDSKHPSEGLFVSSYEVQAWLDFPELSEGAKCTRKYIVHKVPSYMAKQFKTHEELGNDSYSEFLFNYFKC